MLNAGDGPLSPQLLDFDEGNAEETEETVESDLNQFKQAFINERASPEILDYKLHLVEDFVELVNTQEENVRDSESSNLHTLFMAQLYMTEIGRIRYLIKSYLRTRMFKIEKNALAILKDPDMKARLSQWELAFAERYAALYKQHMEHSFLHMLNADERYKNEQDIHNQTQSNTAVPPHPPKLNQYVFCQILEDLGPTQLDETLEGQDFRKDDIFVLPYQLIREMLFEESPKIALM